MLMNRKKKGFTLIELIVVIAILGILAAIAVPRMLGFQERARQQADNQVAAQLKNAFALLYANGEAVVPDINADTIVDQNDTVAFNVTATGGTATVVYVVAANQMVNRAGTALTAANVKALIEGLMTDINIRQTAGIKVTVNGAGAVTSVMN